METRALTAKDIAGWLTPSQAVEILNAAYPPGSRVSKQVLLERLRGGMVQAIAGNSVLEGRRQPREVFYKIPAEDWTRVDTVDILWVTGDLTYRRREDGRLENTIARHYNVRFEPQEVRAIVAHLNAGSEQPPKQPEPSALESNKGGRPRKDWWDDFWIDICRQIYEGDLKPARQADLERAMLDWVSAHGYEVGETSIKTAARKLFKAWKL
jgi:hypothetical protein